MTRLETEEETKLRNNLRELLILECERPGVFIEDIALIKSKLEALDKERFQGATVRARGERFLTGETPTKRALSDEKKYAKGNAIEGIAWQGELTHEREVIKRAFVEHYTELFSPASPRMQDFKDDFLSLMPRLEDDVRQELEEPL